MNTLYHCYFSIILSCFVLQQYDSLFKSMFCCYLVDGDFITCRIDEKRGNPWDLPRVAVDALGAAMLVTIILDLWRIFLGPVVPIPETKQCLQPGLPWFPGHSNET